MAATADTLLVKAATRILEGLVYSTRDPERASHSEVGRLLIRAIAVMIADEASTKDVGERRQFAAKKVEEIAEAMPALELTGDDLKHRLQAAVDALVGVGVPTA